MVLSRNRTNRIKTLWTLSSSGGSAVATETPTGTLNLTGDGTFEGRADQSFVTVPNHIYRLRWSSNGANNRLNIGTTQGGTDIVAQSASSNNGQIYQFKAISHVTWIRFWRTVVGTNAVYAISFR